MLNRITLPGSLFLATIAVVPLIVFAVWDIAQFPFGGTAILITVGVALETMKQIDSQLMMRNYEGFLEVVAAGSRYLLLGRQGAGKGTQAARLAAHLHVPHISTGEMFRAAVRNGSELGLRAQAFMERGELVPDEVVIGVVAERLAEDDAINAGFVLDGFPRTRSQAEELDRVLYPEGLDAAIDIDVPTPEVLRRLSGRRVCIICGATYHVDAPPSKEWRCDNDGGDVVQRDDDTEEAINRRLDLYETETGPLLEFYYQVGLLTRVDGTGTVDEVFDRMLKLIQNGGVLADTVQP